NLIQAVDVATGSPVRSFELPGSPTGIFASALLSNGDKLLVGVDDNRKRIFSSGGKFFVAEGNNRKRITLTDVRTGKPQGEFHVPSCGQFTTAVVSPDGRTLAVGGLGTPRLRLFDLATP